MLNFKPIPVQNRYLTSILQLFINYLGNELNYLVISIVYEKFGDDNHITFYILCSMSSYHSYHEKGQIQPMYRPKIQPNSIAASAFKNPNSVICL